MVKKLPPVRSLEDVKADAVPATAETHAPEARSEGDTQLSVMLPSGVVRQVKAGATERGETLRVTVLRALAAYGYDIDQADLVDRRAEAARIKGELYRRFKAGAG